MKTRIRNMAMVTLMAGALCGPVTSGRALTSMADLQAGGAITNGNLIFNSFQNINQTGDLSVNLADIGVMPLLSDGNYGISFQSANWSLAGTGLNYDLAFDFHVSTLNQAATIEDNALTIVGGSEEGGHAMVAENVVTLGAVSLASELVYINQIGTGLDHTMDSAIFVGYPPTAQSVIAIHKDFAMTTTGEDDPPMIFVSHIDQTFSQVPEPASLSFLLVFGGALMGWRRLRR